MTRTPFGRKTEIYDTTIGWRFTNPELAKKYHPFSMGETAENVAGAHNITRQKQDEFAFHSQMKAKFAIEEGKFTEEIIPIEVKLRKEIMTFETDKFPKFDNTIEKLSKLKPAFMGNGTVTAGNSSGINDGAV